MDNLLRNARSFFLYVIFAVCPILFFTDLTRNPYYTQIVLLQGSFALLWVLWLVEAWRKRELVWTYSDLDWPLLALLGFSLLSWGLCFVQHPALSKSIYSEGSRAANFLLLNTYLVYATAIRLQNPDQSRRLLWVVYIVSAAAALYGISQYFGHEWFWPNSLNPYGSRPVSSFGNPNFLSSYLVVALPVMVADCLYRVTGFPRPLLFGTIILTIGCLLATLTRSSWLGALVGLMVLMIAILRQPPDVRATFPVSMRAVRALVLVMVFTVVFWPRGKAGVYSATVYDRLAEVKNMSTTRYSPVYQRLLIWSCAWQMALDHPVMGKGWGTFELFYPFYQGPQLLTSAFRDLRTHANNSHNEVLEYLSQVGIGGFGLLILMWVVFFRQAASIAARAGPRLPLVWGFIAGAAGMLADNLLNVSVHFAVPAFLFWWWIGSVYAQDPEAVRTRRFPMQGFTKVAVAFSVVGLLLLTGRAFAMWRGEVNFFEGFKLSKVGQLVPAARSLEQARVWHRYEVNNNYELANVYARMGDRPKALMMYQEALDANAGYDEVYFNRATIFGQDKREKEAIAHYRIALAINPMSHDAYNALGNFYFKDIKRYGADIQRVYQQGVEAFPKDRDLWNNLGYFYTQETRWPEAYDAYRKALEIDPDFDLARRNLRVAASHVPGKADDPLLTLPERFQAIDRMLDARRYSEAATLAHDIVRQVPTSFRAYFLLGNAYFFMSKYAEAEAAYRQSLAIEARAATTWKNLGVVLDRQNKTSEAEAAYRKVLEMEPQNPEAKARLLIP